MARELRFQVHDSNRSSSRDTQRTDSRVLSPRVSFADVRPRPHRGDSFDLLGVGTLTLRLQPTPCRTMGGFRFSVEPFIVFRSDVRMWVTYPATIGVGFGAGSTGFSIDRFE